MNKLRGISDVDIPKESMNERINLSKNRIVQSSNKMKSSRVSPTGRSKNILGMLSETNDSVLEEEKAKFNKPIIHEGNKIGLSVNEITPLLKLCPDDPNEFNTDVQNKVKEAADKYNDEQFRQLIEKVKPKVKYYE
jgi:hypothetical protein